MKSSRTSLHFKSFEALRMLLGNNPPPSSPPRQDRCSDPTPLHDAETDEQLFREAMQGVKTITKDDRRENPVNITLPSCGDGDSTDEVLLHLSNLINKGEGFVVSETPEYLEGTGYNVSPWLAKRLHRGDFSIEAHVDLHGLKVHEAKEVFDQFFKDTIRKGNRGVLIVHGRGLCSPQGPVLKAKVVEWLTRGQWRKWVIAFASARCCDGGAGATYVLLRKRPVTKRLKKDHRGTGG